MKLTRKVFSVVDATDMLEDQRLFAEAEAKAVEEGAKGLKLIFEKGKNAVKSGWKSFKGFFHKGKNYENAAEMAKDGVDAEVVNAAKAVEEKAKKGLVERVSERGSKLASSEKKAVKKVGEMIAKYPKTSIAAGAVLATGAATGAGYGAYKGGKAIKKKVDEKKAAK